MAEHANITRRRLLKGAPVALVTAAPTVADPTQSTTPVAAVYHEIVRLLSFVELETGDVSEAELARASDRLTDLADGILDLPSEGPADFVLKLLGHTVNGEHCLCCCPGEARLLEEALSIAGLPGPVPPSPVKSETPILTLYREYRRISEAAARHVCTTDNPDEELERLFWRERDGIEEEMMNLSSTCAADFAAKAIVETDRAAIVQDWSDGRMWIEARALTGTPV